MPVEPAVLRVMALAAPIDLRRTLTPLRRGHNDRCLQFDGGEVWRASNTPVGPVTVQLRADARRGAVEARAWGPGAGWALETLPDLIGAHDDVAPLTSMLAGPDHRGHRVVRDLCRRFPGLRIPRTRAVMEALVPVILEQKVTGLAARRSYRDLVADRGEPAPGPAGQPPGGGVGAVGRGLLVPPSPARLMTTPSWAWHGYGVERKRADTVRRAASSARRLEEVAELSWAEARRRLTSLPGIGPWTAAEVALVALGDPDAVSVGDYHLPNQVAWVLAGLPRADDSLMLELLEPYRGQRGRVIRLITAGGVSAPRRGPRLASESFRHR